MTIGAGKYDDLAREIAERTNADGVVLIINGGSRGDGFSVIAADIEGLIKTMPDLMEDVADELRDEAREAQRRGVKPT